MEGRRRVAVAVGATVAVALSGVSTYLVVHRERPTPPSYIRSPTKFTEIPATQTFRYQAVPNHADRWGPPKSMDLAIDVVGDAMRRHHGPFQLKRPGEALWGVRLPLATALHRMRVGVKHHGGVWRIHPTRHHSATWKMRRIDINPAKYAPTEGTQSIDIIIASTVYRFPGIRIAGIYTCRTILGTNTLSQHAYGNAVDLVGTTALMDQVAQWQYGMARRGFLPLAQLIWRGHEWFHGGTVYDHYNHIHDTGSPMYSGGCFRPSYSRSVPLVPVGDWPLEGTEGLG